MFLGSKCSGTRPKWRRRGIDIDVDETGNVEMDMIYRRVKKGLIQGLEQKVKIAKGRGDLQGEERLRKELREVSTKRERKEGMRRR